MDPATLALIVNGTINVINAIERISKAQSIPFDTELFEQRKELRKSLLKIALADPATIDPPGSTGDDNEPEVTVTPQT